LTGSDGWGSVEKAHPSTRIISNIASVQGSVEAHSLETMEATGMTSTSKKSPAAGKGASTPSKSGGKTAAKAVVGSDPLPRTEVVSKMWDYIKKHKLQNEANKREILADEKLSAVFGKDKVTMFEMNKFLALHLK
jgi:chromatin remodeling complex protein RSC6